MSMQYQIGDLVKVNGVTREIQEVTPYQVGFISELYSGSRRVYYTHEENIKPIEVTDRLLKKNGFEIDIIAGGFSAKYNNGNMIYVEHVAGEAWLLRAAGNYGAFSATSQKLHVHNIQQALRICGVNKKIEV